MERRKSLIVRELESIADQKSILYENLDKIIQQVSRHVELAKTFNENVQPQDLTQIISYELKILQTLTDVNFQLETLLENTPFKMAKLNTQPQSNNSRLVSVISEIPSQRVVDEEIRPEVPLETLQVNVPAPILVSEQILVDPLIEVPETIVNKVSSSTENLIRNTTDHFSEDQIQSLRNTFKEISEKLGLNEPNLSTMKDFYEKPSTSFLRDPSTKITSAVKRENISNSSLMCDDNFQIPEKDINTTSYSAPINKPNMYDRVVDIVKNVDNCIVPTESSASTNAASEENSVYIESDFLCTLSENDDTDSVNLNNVVPIKSSNQTVASAIEKLNNYRHVPADLHETEPLYLPDITLKPTKIEEIDVIQNLSPEKSDAKKKRTKKKNLDDNSDKKIYSLRPKGIPKIGNLCAFSHVETPSEFYIHIADEETAQIDDVSEQIGQYYKGSVSKYATKEEALAAIDQFCVMKYPESNTWYRAEVLNWHLENDSEDVTVQLVDFGSRQRTSFKNLRKLIKQCTTLPKLAIRCHLPLVYPPNSDKQNILTDWPCSSIESLMELSGLFSVEPQYSKFFKIAWLNFDAVQNSLAIDLHSADNDKDTIGEILIDLGLVVQIVDDSDEDHVELREYLQDVDRLEKADNINEAVTGYDARDEARICRFTKRDGTCYKGKHCKLEHKLLPKDGFTMDQELVFKEAMYSLSLPTVGDWITILITSYIDVCNFFVQIIRTHHPENTYVMDKDLYVLLETMNSAKNVNGYEQFKIAPAIGEIVVVKHWTKKWLRGVVRDFTTDEDGDPMDVHVFFVDYGDDFKVTMKDVRKMKPQFLHLPFQAVECYISNYKKSEKCNAQEANRYFNQHMLFRNFAAETMSSQLPLKVHLRSIPEKKDVGQLLEHCGFAEPRTFDFHPLDGCSIDFY